MIDWLSLGFNALWVAGSALLLAVLSAANWAARSSSQRLRDQLAQPRRQATLGIAGLLFCAGMLGTSHILLERVAWGILVLVCSILLVQAIHAVHSEQKP